MNNDKLDELPPPADDAAPPELALPPVLPVALVTVAVEVTDEDPNVEVVVVVVAEHAEIKRDMNVASGISD